MQMRIYWWVIQRGSAAHLADIGSGKLSPHLLLVRGRCPSAVRPMLHGEHWSRNRGRRRLVTNSDSPALVPLLKAMFTKVGGVVSVSQMRDYLGA
jgi:hypothetical protein